MSADTFPSAEKAPQSHSLTNPIVDAVGTRFALVPKVSPYTGGCCNPRLPQGMSIVSVGDIKSPEHLKQVVNQVNSSTEPAPFTSHIEQRACLNYALCMNGVYEEQQITDATGNTVFSLQSVLYSKLSAVNAQNQPVGSVVENYPPGDVCCQQLLCVCVCRTPSTSEWAWLSAVDPNGRERLTFRMPAQEGQFMPLVYNRPEDKCCTNGPDMPFHEHADIYGPKGESNVVGSVDVRGAYGYEPYLCCYSYGVRPEIMTTIQLTQQLSFEDTALAIQMALFKTQRHLEWTVRPSQQNRRTKLPFLAPAQVTME